MFSRMLAIVISSLLPALGLILPMSAAHRANALIAGTLATALAAFSLMDRRACFGAALVGVWVALSAFVFHSTLLEEVVTVTWGVVMFSWLIGPFSAAPEVTWVKPVVAAAAAPAPEIDLPHAA
jgi:hypothetical protein